jgi:hypothetical protein
MTGVCDLALESPWSRLIRSQATKNSLHTLALMQTCEITRAAPNVVLPSGSERGRLVVDMEVANTETVEIALVSADWKASRRIS